MPMMSKDEFDHAKHQKAIWAREMAALRDGVKSLRKATPGQYAEYLIECLKAGGKINRIRNSPFDGDHILIATKSVSIPRGCGASAINVIVPRGIEVTRVGDHDSENPGIRKIGNMDHGRSYCVGRPGCHSAIYSDVAKIMIARGWHFEESEFSNRADKHDAKRLVSGDWPEDEDDDARLRPTPYKYRDPGSTITKWSAAACAAGFLAFIVTGFWFYGFTVVLALMLAGLVWAVWPRART